MSNDDKPKDALPPKKPTAPIKINVRSTDNTSPKIQTKNTGGGGGKAKE